MIQQQLFKLLTFLTGLSSCSSATSGHNLRSQLDNGLKILNLVYHAVDGWGIHII